MLGSGHPAPKRTRSQQIHTNSGFRNTIKLPGVVENEFHHYGGIQQFMELLVLPQKYRLTPKLWNAKHSYKKIVPKLWFETGKQILRSQLTIVTPTVPGRLGREEISKFYGILGHQHWGTQWERSFFFQIAVQCVWCEAWWNAKKNLY